MAGSRWWIMPRLQSMNDGGFYLGEHEVRPYGTAWFLVLGGRHMGLHPTRVLWFLVADTWICTLHGFLVLDAIF